MKVKLKKMPAVLKTAAVLLMAVYIITESRTVSGAVSGAAERCLYVVIPSLFAMTAVSSVLVRSGVCRSFGRLTDLPARKIFGMNGEEFAVFLLSMAAGYPVGAKMLGAMCDEGRVSKRRAELLGGLCFGAGPAFINGVIAHQLYGSETAGKVIFLSSVTANVILALVMSPFLRRGAVPCERGRGVRIDAGMVTECTLSAGRSLAGVCFMIMAFAAVSSALDRTGTTTAAGSLLSDLSGLPVENAHQVIRTILDITAADGMEKGNWQLLPYLCGLTSFGGVCVMFQIQAINSGRLRTAPVVLMRAAAGVLSFGVGRAVMPYFLRNETVTVSTVRAAVHRETSPVPSLMLIIMVIMLFVSVQGTEKRDARNL